MNHKELGFCLYLGSTYKHEICCLFNLDWITHLSSSSSMAKQIDIQEGAANWNEIRDKFEDG
ncbi:hypothetical protein Ccrd_022211, partial [Cynara cardunculus var. scolymus]